MINLGRLFVTEKALITTSKKRIEGLKVCHGASNQNASHQCFLLLCVNTIEESVTVKEY